MAKTTTKRSMVPAKTKNTKNKKNVSVSFLARFGALSRSTRIAAFAVLFGLVGGVYYIYQSSASDGMPTAANELVFYYEIGMDHSRPDDNFPQSMGAGIATLLYGNGLLLCSNNALAMPVNAQPMANMPTWNTRQLTRDEMQALVQKLKSQGFDRAADYQPADPSIQHPFGLGRYIRLNTAEGAVTAATYPDYPDTGFASAEAVVKEACASAVTAYQPDAVYAETITLPSDSPDAAQVTAELPASVDVDPEAHMQKSKELKGQDAKALRTTMQRGPKVYKAGDKIVRARYVDAIPDWVEMKPKDKDTRGKVEAATDLKTRWIIVVPSDQSIPSWATNSFINSDAGAVRNWYNGQTTKSFTVDTSLTQVVHSGKTQYGLKHNCPSGYGWACDSDLHTAWANAAVKFSKPGYSTMVFYTFGFANSQWGTGYQGALNGDNAKTYGTVAIGDGTLGQAKRRFTGAHELGHTFGLYHTCNGTLMGTNTDCRNGNMFPDINMTSTQATNLRTKSPFFNDF